MDANGQHDSPLSTASNVVGILTFVVALAAAAYARVTYLRNSDAEYFRVKASLSWYKTESAWLVDLVAALDAQHGGGGRSGRTERHMYAFVMDDLLKLEQRLLDVVAEVEAKAAAGSSSGASFTLVPPSWQSTRPSVAMAWLPVRTKALELVRQREGLTARVQFLHMSMISSRLRDLESKMWRDEPSMDLSSPRVDDLVERRKGDMGRLEAPVQHMAARDAAERESSGGQTINGPKAQPFPRGIKTVALGGHAASS